MAAGRRNLKALYLVPASLCVCVIASFQLTAFTFRENLAASALLLILFGYATIPWMYLLSGFFTSSDVAFVSYISINFVSGVSTLLLTFLPRLIAGISKMESLTQIHDILKWAFLVFPQFCLGHGLMELAFRQVKYDVNESFGIDSYINPFQLDSLGCLFISMAIEGSIFLMLRLVLNGLSFDTHGQNTSLLPNDEDIDVELERKRLLEGMTANDKLLLYNLRKSYKNVKNKRFFAVKDICLGIQRGECFGLLGLNGAGKSTIFKMLTGEIHPSAGQAMIRTCKGDEVRIFSAMSNEDITIGYCPQKDALNNFLTGWEHLYFYCKLRGIPKKRIHKVSGALCSRLNLTDHIDKLVGTYSKGTKRKLSIAIALIGRPQILLLDEPSSGMDPCSKRYLWKAIREEMDGGCAVVLTSHSMEECEALCTRLAIMVNGMLKCIGSPQHIKNRFGEGYLVTLWTNKEGVCEYFSKTFQQLFPGASLKKMHQSVLEYHVSQDICIEKIVQILDAMKTKNDIKSYSVTQTTLEQVFIQLATQHDENISEDEIFNGLP
ncbi:ATP-binding cassette sub-family A member 13-like [Leptodactylus fuscus]|uniref:ATP-binding cassette sub-family A member 13-like n=1 Tax=Leptodactylus fuscus TaxID=238119 RepID=UPI003F4F18D9